MLEQIEKELKLLTKMGMRKKVVLSTCGWRLHELMVFKCVPSRWMAWYSACPILWSRAIALADIYYTLCTDGIGFWHESRSWLIVDLWWVFLEHPATCQTRDENYPIKDTYAPWVSSCFIPDSYEKMIATRSAELVELRISGGCLWKYNRRRQQYDPTIQFWQKYLHGSSRYIAIYSCHLWEIIFVADQRWKTSSGVLLACPVFPLSLYELPHMHWVPELISGYL